MTPTRSRARPIRVASVPARHPYVEHLGPVLPGTAGADRFIVLPDPTAAQAGTWTPPAMLEPTWIAGHAADFDLLHVHFGTETFPVDHLRAVVAALARVGRPLVHTVHDLENPQLADQSAHRAQLDVLVPAADGLITLTEGAADAVERTWGRRPEVIPHPHVLPLDVPAPPGRPRRSRVAGLHLRDLRPNVDGPEATRTLLDAVGSLRAGGHDIVARVELRDRVRDEAARDAVRRLCAGVAFATLVEAPRASDAELAASLADLDVAVLPYRHGTHSGWLELCWDLGVAVAAPEVGFLAEQHPGPEAFASWRAGSAASLAGALAEPGRSRPGSQRRAALIADRRRARRLERDRIAAAHLALYARVLDRR